MADYLDSDFMKGTEYLNGFLKGILSDRLINEIELQSLSEWIEQHRGDMGDTYPFDEIDFLVTEAMSSNGGIQDEIISEISFFLKDIQKEIIILSTIDSTAAKVREFKGLIAGIFADGVVNQREAFEIKKWLGDHAEFMETHWSLIELKKRVESFLESGQITPKESDNIISFCKIFDEAETIHELEEADTSKSGKVLREDHQLEELLSDADVHFDDKTFAFTGAMEIKREMAKQMCLDLGANYSDTVHKDVDYLVIGSKANPRISQSTYGLKVESAINLNIPIVGEKKFLEAIDKKS